VTRLGGAAVLLCGALGLARAQEAPQKPTTLLWASVSNTSLSLTVGSAQHRALVVAGITGTLGPRDRAAMVGGGVALRSGGARTTVLLEALFGPGGLAARLVVGASSDVGQRSVFGKVTVSHPLQPGADPPEAQGQLFLHARLSRVLQWGASYDLTAQSGERAEDHLGPSLGLRIPGGILVVTYGRGLGRSADQVSVQVRVAG
jgi:hypothetical protein